MGCEASYDEDKNNYLSVFDSNNRKEGYLLKQSLHLKAFRRRWMVLNRNKLYAFRNKQSCINPTEIFDLKVYNRVSPIVNKKNMSTIFTLKSSNKTRIFNASSIDNMYDWIKCIRNATIHTRNINMEIKRNKYSDSISSDNSNILNDKAKSNNTNKLLNTTTIRHKQTLQMMLEQFAVNDKPKYELRILQKIKLPEHEEEVKDLINIIKGFLVSSRENKKYELNMEVVRQRFETRPIYIDILFQAGFYKSNDGKILLYDMKQFEHLENMYKELLMIMAGNNIKTPCVFLQCQSMRSIETILDHYHSYIQLQSKGYEEKSNLSVYDSVYDKVEDGYNTVNLLNDFNHLLSDHSNEFEDIYNMLNEKIYDKKSCVLSKCILLRRNRRNRDETADTQQSLESLYFDTDDIVAQQLLDRIHCHYMHTFDIGHKLTRKEESMMVNCLDIKMNESKDVCYDKYIAKLNNIIASKKQKYENNQQIMSIPTKFVTKHKENPDNEYSFGYRYYYWREYENDMSIYDNANRELFCKDQSIAVALIIGTTPVKRWYISQKYKNLKVELLSNAICTINVVEMNQLIEKACIHLQSQRYKAFLCAREKTAHCYEMNYGEQMDQRHLIAMMAYCNFNVLQFKFSETYRKINCNESIENVKERHRNYYWFGRSLRECVECFGMEMYTDKYGDIAGLDKMMIYRGINKHFTFSSMIAHVNCPFSTTKEYNVALIFCENKGMVLEMSVDPGAFSIDDGKIGTERMCCFDAEYVSDFTTEKEVFFIGGLKPLAFVAIKEPSGVDYVRYIEGLKAMTHWMRGKQSIGHREFITKGWRYSYERHNMNNKQLKQIAFRLMAQEMHRYFPNNPHSHTFETCPEYIKEIVHLHCENIRGYVHFPELNKVTDHFLTYNNNEWINLEVITTIFPNLRHIEYSALQKYYLYVMDSTIQESIISFIKKYPNTSLRAIIILIDPMFEKEMHEYNNKIQHTGFAKELQKYGWGVEVIWQILMRIYVNLWNREWDYRHLHNISQTCYTKRQSNYVSAICELCLML